MWVEDYKWHYDYVRLAWDTGFSFDKCKSPNVDKNKICVVDIDRIVRERDVATVDRYISTVVQYILDDEQAKVLDTNFVKIFRLSQLTVEFLLFCKKYLDNTVVLLKQEHAKSREENKELKTFVNDLQSHIDTLTRQQALATFKCSICSKAFSSEEYLHAHLTRRHSNSENYNVETDKLNLEIKQLKERLNNTEKLLKEKEEQSCEKGVYDSGNTKINELLEKFEQFKGNIDCELKEIKMQKSFYEENYGRLFNIMVSNGKENIKPKCDNTKEILMAETTTQTDKLLHIENLYNRNVLEIQEPLSTRTSEDLHVNEINLKETKGRLDDKISITLAGIEDQMQAFWNKLNELEKTKTVSNSQPDLELINQTEDIITSENARPKIKPRSKFSQPTHNSRIIGNNAETLKLAINQLEEQEALEKKPKHKHKEMQVDENLKFASDHCISNITKILPSNIASRDVNHKTKLEKKSLTESETSESESLASAPESSVLVKPVTSALGKQSITSFNKISADKEVLKNLNKEIQEVVYSRIQELGISKSWPGIPQRSFEKSLEILNHQATLTKRTYSNFDFLKKKINCDVEKQCSKKNNKIKLKTSPGRQKIGKVQNIVKISYRPKSSKPMTNERIVNVNSKREAIEIKNRALYETDSSESEKNNNAPYTQPMASSSQHHQMYSDVVKEFKSLSTARLHNDEDTDVDDLIKKEDLQKGVLKSFPSVGSLSKKKVLFDLEEKSSKREDIPVIQKTGGSTTSIASSILEQSIKDTDDFVQYTENDKTDNGNKEKELNDLSDFDFSDL